MFMVEVIEKPPTLGSPRGCTKQYHDEWEWGQKLDHVAKFKAVGVSLLTTVYLKIQVSLKI